ADEPDVGLQDQDAAARLEQGERDAQLLQDRLRGRQMLEVVAEEREVEVVVGDDVGELEAAGTDKAHVARQRRLDRADVGRPALARLDVADEIALVAGDVDDAGAGLDVALKELAELLPDRILRGTVPLVEPEVVNLLEDDRRRFILVLVSRSGRR